MRGGGPSILGAMLRSEVNPAFRGWTGVGMGSRRRHAWIGWVLMILVAIAIGVLWDLRSREFDDSERSEAATRDQPQSTYAAPAKTVLGC